MRKIYSLALMMLLFGSVVSQALSHTHSHDISSGITASIHAAAHHDDDCTPAVDCDEPHDSSTSTFHIESSHFVLIPHGIVPPIGEISIAARIESESSRRDDRALSTPSRPPKHS